MRSTSPPYTLTRAEFLLGVGAVTASVAAAACGSDGESTSEPAAAPPSAVPGDDAPLKAGLAEGLYGGPVGFDGAEEFQYPLDSVEGRAIWALRRLRRDGSAPEEIRVVDGGSFDFPYPEGSSTPARVFEDETGIRLALVSGELSEANFERAENRDGSIDVLAPTYVDVPAFADLGLLLPLDEFVDRHQPDWFDPEFGYAGGEAVVNRFNRYRGETFALSHRNMTATWPYRVDLMEDPAERAGFEDRYGRELRFPLTWDEHAEVAEYFHRPEADPPLFGSVELRSPAWQMPDWCSRFVCAGNPSSFYFNEDGSANLDSDGGVLATEEQLRGLQWAEPTALQSDILQARALLLGGQAFMGSVLPWITKVTNDPERVLRTGITPGRVVGGALVRRPVSAWTGVFAVNAFADASRHEAAYLAMQWLGAARPHAWASLSQSGVDPLHRFTFESASVQDHYGPQSLATLAEATARSAPIPRARTYWAALDEEISRAMLGEQSPEQAMERAASRWDAMTDEPSDEQVQELVRTSMEFSTVVDELPGA